MKLTQLTVYPIKSTAGIQLSHAHVRHAGLAFDRRFVVSDMNGKFITARTHPRLLQVQAALSPEGLYLTAPQMPAISIEYSDLADSYRPVSVWADSVQAQSGPAHYDQWFSQLLDQPCCLLFFGEQSARQVSSHPQHPVGFADGYPLLLTSEASLADLNQRCQSPVEMAQMRPNIVVTGCQPYAEDQWQRIRIGSVEFELVSPCSRCILTTVSPETYLRDPLKEPFSTLKTYRKGDDGQVYFGQNMIPLTEGLLRQGDPVEVLATRN